MIWPEPVTLRGEHVTLEPLGRHHHDDLVEAVRDGELWKLSYTTIPLPEKMEAEIARRLALAHAGTMLPFAVIENASGKAVGMTTYMNVDAIHRRGVYQPPPPLSPPPPESPPPQPPPPESPPPQPPPESPPPQPPKLELPMSA